MDDPKFNELLDTLSDVFDKYRSGNEDLSKSVKDSTSAIDKQKKLVEVLNKRYKDLDDQLLKGKKKFIDLKSNLDTFNDQIEELEDSAAKLDVQQKQSALAAKYMSAQFNAVGRDLLKTTSGTVVKGLIGGTKNLVTGLQNGASGLNVASTLMTGAVDVVQSSFGAAAKAGETVGSTMAMSTNPRLKVLGTVTSLASSAIGSLAEGVSGLAKFGIEVLTKEAEKTIKAFNETSSAGAMFADGMTGMRKTAKESGLTLEQFSGIIKSNSAAFADAGLSVTDAVKRMGQVNKALKDGKIDERLLKLGYGFEEHGELIANTMASMRRSGVLGTATNAQIAQATENYAKNLRIIADITGEDAKSAMKEAEAKSRQYAVDAKLREIAAKNQMDPAEVKRNWDSMIAVLVASGNDVAGVQQELVAGVNAVAEDHVSGMANVYANMVDNFSRGNTDLTQNLGILSRGLGDAANKTDAIGEQIGKGALIVGGNLSGFEKAFVGQRQLAAILSDPEKIKNAVDNRANAEDAATAEFVRLEREAQAARIAVEAELTNHLGNFGKVMADVVSTLRQLMAKAGIGEQKSWFSEHARGILTGAGTLIGGIAGGVVGAGAGGVGAAPGAFYGAAGGATIGASIADIAGYANGGIASGPVSGYQTTLHGTEAVVPLPDGDTIPVKVQESTQASAQVAEAIRDSITQAIMPQTRMLNDILDTLRDGNKISNGILNNTY